MFQITNPKTLFIRQKLFSRGIDEEKEAFISVSNHFAKVVIIYDNPSNELPLSTQEMLDKLVVACKFKTEQTVYVNHHFSKVSLGSLQSKYQPDLILVFGEINFSKNMGKLEKNHFYEMNGTKILQGESLSKLGNNEKEKGVLWKALKKTLNIE